MLVFLRLVSLKNPMEFFNFDLKPMLIILEILVRSELAQLTTRVLYAATKMPKTF